MSDKSAPVGQRFSHVYHPKERVERDSKRMRRRLAAYIQNNNDAVEDMPAIFASEIGIDVPYSGYGSWDWQEFFAKSDLRDMLDTIPFFYICLLRRRGSAVAAEFVKFVERTFREEGIALRPDPEGGIHYFVDEEFEVTRSATLAVLGSSRYSAAREAFERAHASFEFIGHTRCSSGYFRCC